MTPFGTTSDGRAVHRLTLSAGDLTAHILTYGAALQDVRLAGVPHSLTIGSPDLAAYEGRLGSAGTIMGPVANRITGARAVIDGNEHRFDKNFFGKHTLHGGSAAFHRKVWQVTEATPDGATLQLSLPDGEGGFPGHRTVTAQYRVDPPARLTLTLETDTDAPTLINLANHSYWNLGPHPTTRGHKLQVHADRYLPATDEFIPTGVVADVAGTRFDYRQGRAVEAGAEGLLDNNLCTAQARQPLRPVARLTGPTGIAMQMASTEPGLQIFDGHILDLPDFPSTDGPAHQAYAGLALEAQFWPDAPNNPAFPSILLRPGDDWRQITAWTFTRS
ncbi:MAG: aldose epimerase family protein [Rhodobacter sp.]|nr:aldose epimerase family protein [Rhodobacter sp.]